MTKNEAQRIARDYVGAMAARAGVELMLLDQQTIEREFGWVFFYDSRRHIETGDFRDALAGNAPIVVTKADGRIHPTGTAHPIEYYLTKFAQFADGVAVRLTDVGLTGATLVRSASDDHLFGNAEAVFRFDGLLLRFVRDRGQAFLDVASITAPTVFHKYDDVEVAMGWSTIDRILAKGEPDDLGIVLARLQANIDALSSAFSGDRGRLTRARVERVARQRGQVFVDRLRGAK